MTRTPWHPLTLTAVTPMFLGKFAADPRQQPALPFPVPSLRGALGYWLRALAGAHVGDDLGRLAAAEAATFGSARAGDAGGPSTIWLRGTRPVGVREFRLRSDDNKYRLAYLMGPGLYGASPPACCVEAAKAISLEVRNTGSPVHADLFLSALWALRTFGGIGARTRRGFGTVSLDDRPVRLPCERFQPAWLIRDSADDLTDVLSCVASCLTELGIRTGTAGDGQPSYPRFDLAGRWHVLEPDVAIPGARNAEDALAWTSQRLRDFRLDGAEHTNTEGWRQIVRPYLNGQSSTAEFRAGALGLPVVYTEKATQPGTDARSATVEPVIDGQPARRASPLWLRVRGKGSAWSLRSLAFNATWLPAEGNSLRVKATKGVTRPARPVTPPTAGTIQRELERWFSYIASQAGG
jgi:CRISPR-associated protein Cmr1